MKTSVETCPAGTTTVKRITIILLLAFLGGQLSLFVNLFWSMADGALNPNNSGGGLFSLFSYNPAAGIKLAVIVFLFACANFLMLSLYPEHGWHQLAAGLLGAVAWVAGYTAGNFLNNSLPYGYRPNISLQIIGILIAIPICLLVKHWPDLVGLVLGLSIGVGLCMLELRSLTPIWLSAVFFLELLSRRATRWAALTGSLLWIGLLLLDILISRRLVL